MPRSATQPDHPVIETHLAGYQLLADPLLNKGTAFSEDERDEFDLHGLLPPHTAQMQEQVARRVQALRAMPDDLARQVFLREIQESNETLYYAILNTNLEEWLPVVHVPTVALACQNFSRQYRRPRGLFLSYPQRDQMAKMLSQPHLDQIEAIVVSDGERILGLGDHGANGMAIPIGGASLLSACAGLNPAAVLPILLDMGTDSRACLQDPLYVGWRHERVRGPAYDQFIADFVVIVRERWPHIVLQWEDLAQHNAARLLNQYRGELCTFNDNIQGTATVALATLISALRVNGGLLAQQRIVIFGAGSAGTGIAQLLVASMMADGLSLEAARSNIWMIDRSGLLFEGENQSGFGRPASEWPQRHDGGVVQLRAVIDQCKPTVLIGTSGQAGAFDEAAIRAMAAYCLRPVILPLSNPTSHCEATPADLLKWTNGQALIGTGSPFAPVTYQNQRHNITQTNNAYVFPGLTLGAIAVKARGISDGMLLRAADTLARLTAPATTGQGLLPPINSLHDVACKVAVAVAEQAITEGLADADPLIDVAKRIQKQIWAPHYKTFRRLYRAMA